jgi:hypothetical protein
MAAPDRGEQKRAGQKYRGLALPQLIDSGVLPMALLASDACLGMVARRTAAVGGDVTLPT